MRDLPGIKLHDWQEACLDAWFSSGGRGVVDVATGAGKTMLALAAAHRLQEKHSTKALKVKVVVPKVFLARQWQSDVMQTLNIPAGDIGLYYGGMKSDVGRPFMIYVLNSARGSISRHILRDMDAGNPVFLICDECHHFGSPANAHVFDFLPYIEGREYFSMGLSATPETDDVSGAGNIIKRALGAVVFRYNLNDARHDFITANYEVFQISVEFSKVERDDYEDISDKIAIVWSNLVKKCPEVKRIEGGSLNAFLLKLSRGDDSVGDMARALRIQYIQRKEIVHTAQSRISCSIEIMRRLLPDTKTILFTERIKTANAIYAELNRMYPGRIVRYHSGMDAPEKSRALERYRNSEALAIVCCRALDEGLNVPETDAGVIVSVGNSYRQRVQRIGRLVRHGASGMSKKIYYLHIPDTSESPDILPIFRKSQVGDKGDPIRVHKLSYMQDVNKISHPGYDEYAEQVTAELIKSGVSIGQLSTLAKQLERGSVRTEFQISEEECLARLEAAKRGEKEYLRAMLLFIRIRKRMV
jgi:superfamily II DNA or RNA helicase